MRIYTSFPIRQAEIFRVLAMRGVPSSMVPAALVDETLTDRKVPGSPYDLGGSFRSDVTLFTTMTIHLRAGGRVGDRPITGRKALAELKQQGYDKRDLRNATPVQKNLWIAALLEVARERSKGQGTETVIPMSAMVRLPEPYNPDSVNAAVSAYSGQGFSDSATMFHELTGGRFHPDEWRARAEGK